MRVTYVFPTHVGMNRCGKKQQNSIGVFPTHVGRGHIPAIGHTKKPGMEIHTGRALQAGAVSYSRGGDVFAG